MAPTNERDITDNNLKTSTRMNMVFLLTILSLLCTLLYIFLTFSEFNLSKTCNMFRYQEQAQRELGNNPNLDRSDSETGKKNGIACETLPHRPPGFIYRLLY